MIQVALDLFGKPVHMGDKVVFTAYKCGDMKIGTVVKLTHKKFKIESDDSKWWNATLDRNLNINSDRIIKL